MKQHENYCAYGSCKSPAVCRKDLFELSQVLIFHNLSCGKICHKHYGNNYLICGKSQNKRQKNYSVKTYKTRERIKKVRQQRKQCRVAYLYCSEKPDDEPCRSCYSNRSAEYKNRSVKNGTDYDLSDLRPPVRGKLQCKRGGNAFQNCSREKP